MAPTTSPLSLKRKSQCLQTTGSFPVTPAKRHEESEGRTTPDSHATAPATPSIRERRGRRNLTNGSFRPLSVFTKSLLLPFDLDIDKSFDVLKGNSPNRLEEAKQILTPDHKRIKVTQEEENNDRVQPANCLRMGTSFEMGTNPLDSVRNSQMDLMTALKMTSPEKDAARGIHTDFATLYELPVPEPSQHPAFSLNPFEAATDAPLLSTSTSKDEIKLHNPKIRRSVENDTRGWQNSIERKRSFFGLDFRTPASGKSRNAFNNDE
ncbi:hypothetical protein H2198_000738, partial [Neophaeococcomyces mojaviensis]